MPDTTPTTTRNGLAALLAHHADVLAARWYAVAPGPGAWEVAAALALRDHASDLTAEEETPFVREFLDSVLAFEAEQQAGQVLGATDQQPATAYPYPDGDTTVLGPELFALADRSAIAWEGDWYRKCVPADGALRAVCDAIEADYRGQRGDVAVGALAAVMRIRARAVLPVPVDRAEALPEFELRGDTEIRAAALNERADYLEGVLRNVADPSSDPRYWTAVHDIALGLRRMADEAQQPETGDESCGRFVPDTPRAPGLCASCGDARGWHAREAVEEQPATPVQHAPGKVICCPDCRAKSYTVCRDEPAADRPDTETEAARLCGKTVGVSGIYYRPCARTAGHPEAYCRDATGEHLFLAVADPDTAP